MKLLLALVSVSILLFSCNQTSMKTYNATDSLDLGGRSEIEIRDSLKKVIDRNLMDRYADTIGVYKSPIKVVKSRFVSQEYSRFKDVELTYKNVSKKVVTAIRFKWTGINAFNEPADMGGVIEGAGGGFDDGVLKPGKTKTGEWSINSSDGKKIISAFAYEVMFDDGTKWELKN